MESDGDLSMDVLMLSEDFYPKTSGGAYIDWNVAKHLSDSGDSVTVVTPRNDQTKKRESVAGIDIRRPTKGPSTEIHPNSKLGIFQRLLFLLTVTPYLCHLALIEDFDIVYSTNHLCHPPATLISFVFGLNHVSFVGYSPSIKDSVQPWDPLVILERVNFRMFMGDLVLCRTSSIHNLLNKCTNAKVERLDGIVDAEKIRATINRPATLTRDKKGGEKVSLIFVGRLVEVKNPTELPYIISRIPHNYELFIIGNGPQRNEVEEAIEENEVQDRVKLAGRLPHEETLRAIYDSDVLILPSEVESYGAVVFEALSLNTPVLATPVGVFPEIDHPKLTTAPIGDFPDTLSEIEIATKCAVDEETLERFSVNRFTRDVRKYLVAAISTKSCEYI